jgi:hypothetical protein
VRLCLIMASGGRVQIYSYARSGLAQRTFQRGGLEVAGKWWTAKERRFRLSESQNINYSDAHNARKWFVSNTKTPDK